MANDQIRANKSNSPTASSTLEAITRSTVGTKNPLDVLHTGDLTTKEENESYNSIPSLLLSIDCSLKELLTHSKLIVERIYEISDETLDETL